MGDIFYAAITGLLGNFLAVCFAALWTSLIIFSKKTRKIVQAYSPVSYFSIVIITATFSLVLFSALGNISYPDREKRFTASSYAEFEVSGESRTPQLVSHANLKYSDIFSTKINSETQEFLFIGLFEKPLEKPITTIGSEKGVEVELGPGQFTPEYVVRRLRIKGAIGKFRIEFNKPNYN